MARGLSYRADQHTVYLRLDGIRGGGPSADLRQEFGQAAKYTSFQDRLMKFSGLALGTVVYTLK